MAVMKHGGDGSLWFECPGCGDDHAVNITRDSRPRWQWNGSLDKPTLTPSLLVRSGHYADRHSTGQKCWCDYNAEHPDDPDPFVCYVCHSFVTDGRIEFLNDCTHTLAGQTVDLPEIVEAN